MVTSALRHSACGRDSVLKRAHVALTPGRDFGPHWSERFLRLSFASSMDHLEEAVQRLQQAL